MQAQVPYLATQVLITGATGFLGAYIMQELVRKNYDVHALRRGHKTPFFISDEIIDRIHWIEGDVLDVVSLEEAINARDAVIHAAGVVSFSGKDKKQMFKTNAEGTANVVNAALKCGVRKLVHVSSVAALGRHGNGEHVNEETHWNENAFTTPYALSKYLAEMEVWRAIGEGLNAVIVNPSTLIGFGDWNSTSCAIFRNVYNEFPWYSAGVNGFVDVEDVARATVMLMEADINSERFILNGENYPIRRLFDLIADGFKRKRPSREATPFLAGIAWRYEKLKSFFTGNTSLLTRETARVAQSKTFFENAKIKAFLPQFSFTPLELTVANACRSYLSLVTAS
ncbi:MAG TPA: NAD-dependent epimerase/dehydratase family protein [Puia sp.]|nr:NAD-dependent epimerase/dehydratase family protein [Puia sp.]